MKKYKRRMRIYFLLLICVLGILGFSCYNSWKQIALNKSELKELQKQYDALLNDEEDLESNLAKLQDPSYVAQYAREKYFYSKDGEIIIDLVDDKDKVEDEENK